MARLFSTVVIRLPSCLLISVLLCFLNNRIPKNVVNNVVVTLYGGR